MTRTVAAHRRQFTDTWRSASDGVTGELGRLKILEGLLGFLLIFVGIPVPLVPITFPVAYLAVFLLILVGITRRPTLLWPASVKPLLLVVITAVIFTSGVSYVAGYAETGDWVRRFFRVGIVICMVLVLAAGRVDLASVLRGYLAGLLVNVPLSLTGVVSGGGDVLAGAFADKNQAGLNYAMGGLLVLALYRRVPVRITLMVLFAGLVWMTQSRTALAAYAAGLLWLMIARHGSTALRIIVGFLLVVGVDYIAERFSHVGVFADRVGSDALRDRIDEASGMVVAQTPWYGQGWGQGTVEVENSTWFFHNAYEVLRVEGGWVLLGAVLLFTVAVGMHLTKSGYVSLERVACQAATFAILVCAWKLGDVFLTVAWGLAMATGLRLRGVEDSRPPRGVASSRGVDRVKPAT